jgi:1,4-dihydroxy-2-naphthoyl-CoA hydrolase
MLFKENLDLDFLNNLGKNTMVEFLGIKFTKIGDDFLEATMPVNERTKQPMGLLHGGGKYGPGGDAGQCGFHLDDGS